MVYKELLLFRRIVLINSMNYTGNALCKGCKRKKDDPPYNMLALFCVNRQIYEESHRVFYTLNRSVVLQEWSNYDEFIIGIGRHNASLLRQVDVIVDEDPEKGVDDPLVCPIPVRTQQRNIWNNTREYYEFAKEIQGFE